MRKIKFKTEYVPLRDEAINQHKDFDQLMTAYLAAPKISWVKKFIQNKWTMFGGGLVVGAVVATLVWSLEFSVQSSQSSVVSSQSLVSDSQSAIVSRESGVVSRDVMNDSSR